jgi:hypothetical protein
MAFTVEQAVAELCAITIETDYGFIVDCIKEYDRFDDWAEHVLGRTAYGAAIVLEFRDCSNSEMMRDLRETWELNGGAAL